MDSLPKQALALKWSFFFTISSQGAFEEYIPLYLKQFGFNASQIGFTSLMGLPLLFEPLLGFLGDRFRARKLILLIVILLIIPVYLAPLLPLVTPFRECNEISSTNHTKVYQRKSLYHYVVGNDTEDFSKTINKSNLTVWRFSLPHAYLKFERVKRNRANEKLLNGNGYLPWSSTLFIYMIIFRGLLYEVLKRGIILMYCVSTMSYLKKDSAKFGSFYSWGHIGGILLFFAVGITATFTYETICGIVSHGYYATLIWPPLATCLALPVLPWITFEYFDHRVVNWSDVRSVLLSCHYVIALFITIILGCCSSFQQYWEYWYVAELSGSPVVMTIGGLFRRPCIAASYFSSTFFVNKLGELRVMAMGLFVSAVSLLALSFVQIPWLVVALDIPMSAVYAISASASYVHFSKAGSKASSATILGKN